MAIFHLSAKPVQRSKGRSATSAAAYRAGVCLSDERTGEVHDYTRKQGVEHTEIITPTGESIDREKLWNLAETAEKRKDGTTAREYEIALPEELTHEERKALVQEFGKYLAERHGCAVDIAIHEPNRKGDQRNHHAHILCTTRQFQPGGKLGAKCDVELSDRDRQKKNLPGRKTELDATRAQWAHLVNGALERAGHLERVSHERLEAQGIDREPTNHLGPVATAMERRGERTERGDLNREPDADRAAQVELAQEEKVQVGTERMREQAREWRIAQEQARQRAIAAEKARHQERERLEREAKEQQDRIEAERKAQEKERLERERVERREQDRSRGPRMR